MTGQCRPIAVIDAGPSASRTWTNSAEYGDVIAIDRAALLVVDRPYWWLCGSPELYLAIGDEMNRRGARLIAGFGTIAILLDKLKGEALDRFVASRPFSLEAFSVGIALFPTSTAVTIAYQFGARQLDLFGFDLCGERTFDDMPIGEDTSVERWALERSQVGALVRHLRGRGALVRWVEISAEPEWPDDAWYELIRGDRRLSDVESCRAEFFSRAADV